MTSTARLAHVDAQLAGLNWVQGIIAIERKFAQLMEAMNVTEVPAEGEAFDPARHEAVGQQPGAEGKVLHVVQKGYQLGDRSSGPRWSSWAKGAASGYEQYFDTASGSNARAMKNLSATTDRPGDINQWLK